MKGISTFTLKIIAIVTMLIDHVGHVFFPSVMAFRIVGRIAFPIFAYLLAEGYYYTKDVKKYLLRLGISALISEVLYDLAIMGKPLEFEHQNVFFTLFLAVLMLWVMSGVQNTILKYGIVVVIFFAAVFLHTDYSGVGLLLVFVFYVFRNRKRQRLLFAGMVFVLLTGGIQFLAILALPILALHNGKEGPKCKLFFYGFYPAHLLLLYLIQQLL